MFEDKKTLVINKIKEFFPISDEMIENLQKFVDLLLKHNQEINLIGKSTIDDIWNRHILDSAQLIKYIKSENLIIGDFGSGAGLPALILSIFGVKEIHLIEKSFRKCEFLQIAKNISNNKVIIHQKRAEEIKDLTFDVVISRAFAPMDKILKTIGPFSKKETIGIFLKGKNIKNEIEVANKINKFDYELLPTITSDEGSIIITKNFK